MFVQEEIEGALEQVCSIVPQQMKSECKLFIKTYTPQLIDLLLQNVTPKLICSTLTLCPEQNNQVFFIFTFLIQSVK